MATLNVEVSEGQITNAIAVALAESFSPERKDALVRDIVRAHLSQKESSYDKETLFSKRVGAIVRQIAEEQIKAVFEQMRPDIEAVIASELGPQFKTRVVDQVRYACSRIALENLRISASIETE